MHIDTSVIVGGNTWYAGDIIGKVAIDPNGMNINYVIKNKEEIENMETLYSVTTVWKDGTIEIDKKVVAKTEEEAKFKAGLYSLLEKGAHGLEDISVIVTKLGQVKVEKK